MVIPINKVALLFVLRWHLVGGFLTTNRMLRVRLTEKENLRNSFIPENMDEIPLSQIFQRAMVLQRTGMDTTGALKAYEEFLQVAQMHDVDPKLYAEVYSNMVNPLFRWVHDVVSFFISLLIRD
jgi:hypothetical protein